MILSSSYYNKEIIAILKKTKNKIKTKNINAILKEWNNCRGKKSKHTLYCQYFGRGSTAMELQL